MKFTPGTKPRPQRGMYSGGAETQTPLANSRHADNKRGDGEET